MRCALRNNQKAILGKARELLDGIDEKVCVALASSDTRLKTKGPNSVTALANRRFRRADSIIKAKIHQAEAEKKSTIAIIRLDRTNEVLDRVKDWVDTACKQLGESSTAVIKETQKLARRLMERLVGESIFEQRRLLKDDSRFTEDTSCFDEVRAQGQRTGLSLDWLFDNKSIIKHVDFPKAQDDKSFEILAPLHRRKEVEVRASIDLDSLLTKQA